MEKLCNSKEQIWEEIEFWLDTKRPESKIEIEIEESEQPGFLSLNIHELT